MGEISGHLLIAVNRWHVAHPAGDAGEGGVVVAATLERKCLQEGVGLKKII